MPPRIKPAAPGVFDMRFNALVVEFMGRGYSLTAFAGEIGASRAILDQWIADHPTFARAVECGHARRARVLEDRLLAAKGAAAFGLHMEALKTAAPQDWKRDRRAKGPPAAAPSEASPEVALPDNGRG